MELRPYQLGLVDDTILRLSKAFSVIMQLPTGGGKSVCMASISLRASTRGRVVLVLTESTKIFSQLKESIPGAVPVDASVKDTAVPPTARVFLAMTQTLVRRPMLKIHFASLGASLLVMADEIHIGTHAKLVSQFPNAWKIGVTATPVLKDAPHLSEFYDISEGPQVSELISDGFLSHYIHYARVSEADLAVLEKSGGDYTEASQEMAFDRNPVYDGLEQDILNMKPNKAMIFCASIRHCEIIYKELSSRGIRCLRYHSKMSKDEQMESMSKYKCGAVRIVISVGALTKGFDDPATDYIFLVRATTKLSVYLQMCGRGSRTHPEKHRFVVVDYGKNYSRFGLWSDRRDWRELWSKKKKKGESVPGEKVCVSCFAVIPTQTKICPYCGVKQPVPKREQAPDTIIKKIGSSADNINGKTILSLTAKELSQYAKLSGNHKHAIRICKLKYTQGKEQFIRDFASAMGYNHGWVDYQLEHVKLMGTRRKYAFLVKDSIVSI